jgi:branched-chain amino acid transport system permease protein
MSIKRKKITKVLPFALLTLMLIIPWASSSIYLTRLLIFCYIFSLLATSWDILYSYAGIATLGTSLAFGLGGLFYAILNLKIGLQVYVSAFLSISLTILVAGFIVGFLSLRLRGSYLVIVTVAFAHLAYALSVTKYAYPLTGGEEGLSGFNTLVSDIMACYYLTLALSLILHLLLYFIMKSKIGIFFACIRDDEIASEHIGINISKLRLIAFIISALFGGMSGLLYASYNSHIDSWAFSFDITFLSVAMSLIGGSGTIIGPILGSLLIVTLQEYLRWIGIWRMLIYGLLIVGISLFRPKGILGPLQRKIFAWKSTGEARIPSQFFKVHFSLSKIQNLKRINDFKDNALLQNES